MAEYIEREAFLEHMQRTSRYFDVKFDIEEMPTIDAVPVVRCKDCIFRKDSVFAGVGNIYCYSRCCYFPLNGYCSYGKRKEGAEC